MRKNELWEQDNELFERMAKCYQSENEKLFFEKLRYKQENVFTFMNDLILDEDSNDDKLYIVRCEYDEYVVGKSGFTGEKHVMCLSSALDINLKEAGFLDKDITLFQWLRNRDYQGVEFDHNYDDF